jgi:alanine dehydrogenase
LIIGVPRERKIEEHRLGIVPSGVKTLVKSGHSMIIESGAGLGTGYTDDDFQDAGAEIMPKAKHVWEKSDMVIKVKEPQPDEYQYLRSGLTLFCYLHLAALPDLTKKLIESGVTAIAFETIQTNDGILPCLMPMSEIAGRMSVQVGARYLMRDHGGPGILLGGVPGVPPCEVLILGGGTSGTNAAKLAVGMGAHVMIMDVNLSRLAYLDDIFGGRITTVMSDEHNIETYVPNADLVIGAVLLPGRKAPVLVSKNLVKKIRPGSVIVDIAVDQGGCIETIKPTTHDDPVYKVKGVTHYGVANMPGAVPRTSTQALTNATLPYLIKLANMGIKKALFEVGPLQKGLNICPIEKDGKGVVTCKGVADSLNMPYSPTEECINNIQ